MVIFHSYVSLPEGIFKINGRTQNDLTPGPRPCLCRFQRWNLPCTQVGATNRRESSHRTAPRSPRFFGWLPNGDHKNHKIFMSIPYVFPMYSLCIPYVFPVLPRFLMIGKIETVGYWQTKQSQVSMTAILASCPRNSLQTRSNLHQPRLFQLSLQRSCPVSACATHGQSTKKYLDSWT